MFDLRYQLRLNELYDFTSASYINYTLTQQHLRSLELMFTGEVPIRFNRHTHRLYIDWNWGMSEAPAGMIMVAECYSTLNVDAYPDVWNDRWLKEYATALIKRTWGNNLKKFAGMQLPGGVTLNGETIYQEAVDEIEDEIDMIESDDEDDAEPEPEAEEEEPAITEKPKFAAPKKLDNGMWLVDMTYKGMTFDFTVQADNAMQAMHAAWNEYVLSAVLITSLLENVLTVPEVPESVYLT